MPGRALWPGGATTRFSHFCRAWRLRLKQDVVVTDETITAHSVDGRAISVPLAWSWRLSQATPEQRARWEIIGDGQGVHWPDINEDLSAEGMLHGVPARRRN